MGNKRSKKTTLTKSIHTHGRIFSIHTHTTALTWFLTCVWFDFCLLFCHSRSFCLLAIHSGSGAHSELPVWRPLMQAKRSEANVKWVQWRRFSWIPWSYRPIWAEHSRVPIEYYRSGNTRGFKRNSAIFHRSYASSSKYLRFLDSLPDLSQISAN